VLDRASPLRRADLLDAAALLEHPRVVGDVAERLFEQVHQLVGARLPLVQDLEDFHPQRVGKRPDEA
jgi:hypothetical protein